MMSHRIEVATLPEYSEAQRRKLLDSIEEGTGIRPSGIELVQAYSFEGALSPEQLVAISRRLLEDQVTTRASVDSPATHDFDVVAEIRQKPGVTDQVAQTIMRKLPADVAQAVEGVYTTYQLALRGVNQEQARRIARYFYNPVVEEALVVGKLELSSSGLPPYVPHVPVSGTMMRIVDLSVADDELERISGDMDLALKLPEMKAIQEYFARAGRLPTDVELEIIAQTWSDHCRHKRFNAPYKYVDAATGKTETFPRGLLKEFIRRATEYIGSRAVLSAFHDNAGVVALDDEYCALVKVETHNYPSAIGPFGGANTGAGGVIRDIMGCGRGTRAIANTDVFCTGELDVTEKDLPAGVIPPRRFLQGIVAGVRDYGNKMGIPTVNGSVYVEPGFNMRGLVYCGTAGIAPRSLHGTPWHEKKAESGDYAVIVGGKSGKDGIHGATLSSKGTEKQGEEKQKLASQSVQIGNPITQKRALDFQLEARDRGLYRSVTDLGAGGISCATGEMATEAGGAEIDISKEPLKYAGLSFGEIEINEGQERMCFGVPPEKLAELQALADEYGVDMRVLGRYNGSGKYVVRHGDTVCAELAMDFMHGGVPMPERVGVWVAPKHDEPSIEEPRDYNALLRAMLARPSIASKEWIVRQYDHEVQAATVVKPLTGEANDGPSDAAVLWPIEMRRKGSHRGLILSSGICPRRSRIDTYWMTAGAIDEAVRNAVAVGAEVDPEKLFVLDNFCWSDPDNQQRVAELVRAGMAWYDFTTAYKVPTISGKDSMSNHHDYVDREGRKRRESIPPSLLVTAMGVMDDVRKATTMDLKDTDGVIFALGLTDGDELGASEYFAMRGAVGNNVPKLDSETSRRIYQGLHRAIYDGLVRSCHDCSEGGLGVALAEMAFAGGVGVEADLRALPTRGSTRSDYILFSESNGRLLVEVPAQYAKRFESYFPSLPVSQIGQTTPARGVTIYGFDGQKIVRAPLGELKEAWQAPLRW